jgi:predicted Zn-dependent protease
MNKQFFTWFATIVLILFNSCARNPVTGRTELSLMSTEQEVAMGKGADPQIVAQFGLYEDPKLQRFIEEKGQQMAAISHRNNLKYEFKVVDSPVVNAFAVPGGYVYFTRGIMAHFNNEAEFAGVLGHEIGHITARHSAQQQSKAMLAQVGLIAGMIAAPQLGQYAEAAQQGIGLLFLKFGRDDERESDRLGVEYSTKIGYDAKEMAGFFNTLSRMGGEEREQIPDFLSTHPNPADRNRTVKKLAEEWQQKTNAADLKVNRESYLKMIDGIIYGDDPKQGFTENNMFYHPVLKFQFPVPAGWALQNSPQQVQMAPKDGKAVMMLMLAPGNSLQTAAQAFLEQYKMVPVENKTTTVNGLQAIAVIADQQSQQDPQQQQQQQQPSIRALMYFIEYGGNVYNMMGITSAQDFNTYYPVFNSNITGFRQLTDQEKINRKPDRVRIKPVKQSGTLSQALTALGSKSDKMKEVAVLNGMQLNDKVEKGMLIKVLEQ